MIITKQQKILNIISEIRNSHTEMDNIFLYGSCLNFFMILRCIFPEAEPYYNVDHIITKIDNRFYDITGLLSNVKGYSRFDQFYSKKRTSRAFSQMYNYEHEIHS